MTLTIELSPEELAHLRLRAAGSGQDAARYAADLLRRDLQNREEENEPDEDDRPIDKMDPDEKAKYLAELAEPFRPTPERIAEKQARFLASLPPATLQGEPNGLRRVLGQWPGDETEEELLALERRLDDEDAGRVP